MDYGVISVSLIPCTQNCKYQNEGPGHTAFFDLNVAEKGAQVQEVFVHSFLGVALDGLVVGQEIPQDGRCFQAVVNHDRGSALITGRQLGRLQVAGRRNHGTSSNSSLSGITGKPGFPLPLTQQNFYFVELSMPIHTSSRFRLS